RPRAGAASGRLCADQQSLSRGRRDLRARACVVSGHRRRGRHPHLPDRRHGVAAQGTHIIYDFAGGSTGSSSPCLSKRGSMKVAVQKLLGRFCVALLLLATVAAVTAPVPVLAQSATQAAAPAGGEASLVLPDLSTVSFHGVNGRTLLMGGLVVCVF